MSVEVKWLDHLLRSQQPRRILQRLLGHFVANCILGFVGPSQDILTANLFSLNKHARTLWG